MAFQMLKTITILLMIQELKQITAQRLRIYKSINYTGENGTATFLTCGNYIIQWIQQISSIDKDGHTTCSYDETDCKGNFIELSPRSQHAKNLADWNFDNVIKSTGPCPEQHCPLQITEGEANVTIFSKNNFKGLYHDIYVKGCTQIPSEYHNQTKSILTNGHCVHLYKTKVCNYESGTDFIEVKPGTPYHNDIFYGWNFPAAKAISRCDYICLNDSFVVPEKGNVFLFQNVNFTGDKYNFSILAADCVLLPIRWRGLAESIGLGFNTCVIVYERRMCAGRQLQINDSVADLNTVNFGGKIRSLRSCNLDLTRNFSVNTTNSTEIPTSSVSQIFSTVVQNSGQSNYTIVMPTQFDSTTEYNKYNSNKQHESVTFSPVLIAVVVVVPLAAVILSVVVVFCVFKHCSPCRKEGSKLSEKEIREFLSGLGVDLLTNGGGATKKENDYSTEFLAQNSAYNMEYELARSNIEIDPGALLGSGEFGIVYKGKLAVRTDEENAPSTNTREKTTVAIKTVNQTSGLNGIRSLLKEVKVMLYMGQHTNIAKLIGCCTDKIREGDIMVVMEYCSEGSLESYLKKNRMSFNNLVKKGKLELASKSTTDITEIDTSRFDTLRIIQWGLEVASGMEFLSNAKVIHSDLAARNILLDDQLVAKISDFGLSRQLYAYSQYMKKHQEPLPFRWMAIESLKCLEFSTKSDVWSYGVLLWEMFSLGEKPYPGLGWNEAFISNLESGLRLAKPKNSTNEFYNLLLRCWDENPEGRPSFTTIVEEIQEVKAGFSSDAYTTL